MKNLKTLIALTSLAAVIGAAMPAAAADLCLQFSGVTCDVSGDAGFFRFMNAKLPKTVKKGVSLHGRACGTGTATGSSAMIDDPATVHLSAFYVCDASPGVIEANFPVGMTDIGTVGTGRASSGGFSLGSTCVVTIVDCTLEP